MIGVINISMESEREIGEEDVRLLTTLSEIAGNAIQNISLKEQTIQRLERMTATSSIERAITSTLDLNVSLSILVSQVINQLEVDAADILLYNPYSNCLIFDVQGFSRLDSFCLIAHG